MQVHPSDDYALLHEGQFGKTEMWYVLESEAGAGEREIYHAKSFVSVLAMADGGNIDGIPLMRGDSYYIPAASTAKIGGNADYILTYMQGE